MNVGGWSDIHLDRFGDFDALVFRDAVWTNRARHDHVCRLATALVDIGVHPGDRVLILLPNRPEYLIAVMAILRVGAVVVRMSVDASSEEVEQVIAHCAPACVISSGERHSAASAPHRISMELRDGWHCYSDLIERHAGLDAPVPRSADDLAEIFYTSGTTSIPKGVSYTHGALAAFAQRRGAFLSRDQPLTVKLAVLPLAGGMGGTAIVSSVWAKSCLVVMDAFDPSSLLSAIERYRVVEMALVPTMCEALIACADLGRYDISSLGRILTGGAPVPVPLLDRFEARLGVRPQSFYGLSEHLATTFPSPTNKVGVSGRLHDGIEARILGETGEEVASGEIGELALRSPTLSAGYYRNPEVTAEVFRDGWVRTGDIVRLDSDNDLFIVGRRKEMIIQGGINVYPQEVIEVITRLRGVQDCAVVGVPNTFLGEEVVACVVAAADANLTEDDVLAHCRASMDPRKMPASVRFIAAVPRTTGTGKIRSVFLQEQIAAERAQVIETPLARQLREATSFQRRSILRDDIRRRLARLVPPGRAAVDDAAQASFGQLGLDSLGAVRLANELSVVLQRTIAATETFAHPTVDELAAHLVTEMFPEPVSTSPAKPETGPAPGEPVAVIGIGCRLPGASSPAELWDLLVRGADMAREMPPGRWPGSPGLRGSFLDAIDQFDAQFFGLAAQAADIDPQHRLALEVTWEALEDAGCSPLDLRSERVGLFVGLGASAYPSADSLGVKPGMAVGRICHFLGIRGPVATIDTTCSSSLVALHYAVQSLRARECDLAIVAGVTLLTSPDGFDNLVALGVLASDGRSKAFDAGADGLGRGEGCAVVIVKRSTDAIADEDRIYGLIRGTAINHDGRSSSLTAPNPLAHAELIRAALGASGLAPDAVQYLEAHGTGTLLGDPIEIEGLASVFAARSRAPLAVGSVKTNIGHLEYAAGLAGLLKLALSIYHRRLPASLHCHAPNPLIPWNLIPIRVQTELGPWPDPAAPLVGGVSSFGLSGTNAHAVVSEAPDAASGAWRGADELADQADPLPLVISARTRPALDAHATHYAGALDSDAIEGSYRDVAYTASCRRAHLEHRRVVVGRSRAEWADKLRANRVIDGIAAEPRRELAMVFNGQGPEWWGMGRELMAGEPVYRAAVERCAALIDQRVPWRLLEELQRDEATSRLGEIAIAQPAMFAVQIGLFELWRSWGVEPTAVVGHSLGEVAAACVAAAIELEQAVWLVTERGRIMHKATGLGKMAAVSLSAEAAERFVARFPGLDVAASNSPHTTVLGGDAKTLELALQELVRMNVECTVLRIGWASHCALASDLADELGAAVDGLTSRRPTIQLISSVTGQPVETVDAGYWGSQVRSRVRFHDATTWLLARGYRTFVEVGPHSVLLPSLHHTVEDAGLVADVTLASTLRRGIPERETFLESLGQVFCAGYPVDWNRRYAVRGRTVSLPRYPWQTSRYWNERTETNELRRVVAVARSDGASTSGPPDELDRLRAATPGDRAAALQRRLCDELGELLQVPPDRIPVGETLSALGLDSLALLRLRTRLARALAIKLPPSAVGGRLSVVHIASTLASLLSPAPDDLGPGSSVVYLRAAGADPPLVLVHPVGGGVSCYQPLADRLRHRVLACEAPGLSDDSIAFDSIHAIARHYIQQLSADVVDRPCVLGGWSFGGMVALEMAAQLRAGGAAVPLVVAIDTYFPPDRDDRHESIAQLLWFQLSSGAAEPTAVDLGADEARLGFFLLELISLEGAGPAAAEAVGRAVVAARGDPTTLASRAIADLVHSGLLAGVSADDAETLYRVFQSHGAAAARFRPRPYDGDVLLIRGAQMPASSDRGWRSVVRRLVIEQIDADHLSIVRPPFVDRVATLVSARLDSLSGTQGGRA